MWRRIVIVALCLSATSCGEASGPAPRKGAEATVLRYVLPTHSGEINLASIRDGKLHITIRQEGKACAWVGDEQAPTLWPPGYAVLDNPLRLLDEKGETVAKDGDMVTVGGGYGQSNLRDCPGEPGTSTWYVSSVGEGALTP
jgi:hypothetical protein